MKKNLKITHITTVHPRYDSRIFVKECSSLAEVYQEVNLIVADDKGDEVVNGVNIYDLSKPKGRKERVTKFGKKAFNKALALNSDIYHFHDPELIRVGAKLRKKGKKVIYDVHEDVPRQMLKKTYFKGITKNIVSFVFEKYEDANARKFSAIITSTEHIKERFLKNNVNSEAIKNYSVRKEFSSVKKEYDTRNDNTIIYIGGITKTRGIIEVLDAIGKTKNEVKLILAGTFHDKKFKNEAENHPNWDKVDYRGFLSREQVVEVLAESRLGLVTLLPLESYKTSLPIKMFEYMMAEIPVIASNFNFWQELFTKEEVLFVNPHKSAEIAEAIDFILENKTFAKSMISKCSEKVNSEMNWEVELQKLVSLYDRL